MLTTDNIQIVNDAIKTNLLGYLNMLEAVKIYAVGDDG